MIKTEHGQVWLNTLFEISFYRFQMKMFPTLAAGQNPGKLHLGAFVLSSVKQNHHFSDGFGLQYLQGVSK